MLLSSCPEVPYIEVPPTYRGIWRLSGLAATQISLILISVRMMNGGGGASHCYCSPPHGGHAFCHQRSSSSAGVDSPAPTAERSLSGLLRILAEDRASLRTDSLSNNTQHQ